MSLITDPFVAEQPHDRVQACVQLHEGQEVRGRHRRLPRHPRQASQLSENQERNSGEIQRQSQKINYLGKSGLNII